MPFSQSQYSAILQEWVKAGSRVSVAHYSMRENERRPASPALSVWGKKLLIQLEINVTFYSKPSPYRVIVYSNRVHNILTLKSTTF